ncbi:hypothetical protein L596_014007 [Steinernema carpocapsae]|uniref:MADF domain-containing protein n=1 Tax=Steinernema carpocapsae TaxID=34508 RepID=A0A4U5NAD5_STECR|nr:hypothetical protein L596_014007 [Steinernema carpocapsae]
MPANLADTRFTSSASNVEMNLEFGNVEAGDVLESDFPEENVTFQQEDWRHALIEEVLHKPALWRIQDSSYSKKDSKKQAWSDVTANLNLRFEMNLQRAEVYNAYKSLHNNYLRHYRASKVTGSASKKKPWKYEDYFGFMVENVKAIDKPRILLGSPDSEDTDEADTKPFSAMSSTSLWSTPTAPKRARRMDQKNLIDVKMAGLLDKMSEKFSTKEGMDPGSKVLGMFLAESVRNVEDRNPGLAAKMRAELVSVCSQYDLMSYGM